MFSYFPDKYAKRVPPVKYFWNVLAVCKPEKYKEVLTRKLKEVKDKRGLGDVKITMTEEMKNLFNNIDPTTQLNALCTLKSRPEKQPRTGRWRNAPR